MSEEIQMVRSENSYDHTLMERLDVEVDAIEAVVNSVLDRPIPTLGEEAGSGSLIWGDGTGIGLSNVSAYLSVSVFAALSDAFDLSVLGDPIPFQDTLEHDTVVIGLQTDGQVLLASKINVRALEVKPMPAIAAPSTYAAALSKIQPMPMLALDELNETLAVLLVNNFQAESDWLAAGFDLRMTQGVIDRIVMLYINRDMEYAYSVTSLEVTDV